MKLDAAKFQRAAEILINFGEALPKPFNPRERTLAYVYAAFSRAYASQQALKNESYQHVYGECIKEFWGPVKDFSKVSDLDEVSFWNAVRETVTTIGSLLYATRKSKDTQVPFAAILPPALAQSEAAAFCVEFSRFLIARNSERRSAEMQFSRS